MGSNKVTGGVVACASYRVFLSRDTAKDYGAVVFDAFWRAECIRYFAFGGKTKICTIEASPFGLHNVQDGRYFPEVPMNSVH